MRVYVVYGWAPDDDTHEYGIKGAFSKRADAEEYAAKLNMPMSWAVFEVVDILVDAPPESLAVVGHEARLLEGGEIRVVWGVILLGHRSMVTLQTLGNDAGKLYAVAADPSEAEACAKVLQLIADKRAELDSGKDNPR